MLITFVQYLIMLPISHRFIYSLEMLYLLAKIRLMKKIGDLLRDIQNELMLHNINFLLV
jgi:hypothetical protein